MKIAVIMWLCLLTLYAPIELSRLILDCGLCPKLVFELAMIWFLYLVAVATLIKIVRM